MNYLMTRHPFFQVLAKEIRSNGENAFLISFSLSENFYKGFNEVCYLPYFLRNATKYKITDEELLKLKIRKFKYAKIYGEKISSKYLEKLKKYLDLIDKYISSKEIDVVILYNGGSVIEQLMLYICRKNGIETFFLEEGYFRPYTITVDKKGINYDSSIPRDRDFYEKIKVLDFEKKIGIFGLKDISFKNMESENKFNKIGRKVLNTLGFFLNFKNEHKMNTIRGYLVQEYNVLKFKKMKNENIILPKNYIFVPFQVHSDTQILFNSAQIKSMEKLVEVIIRELDKYNKNSKEKLAVIFKEHPKDIGRINYKKLYKNYENKKEVIFLKKYDMNKLIKNSQIVITINSTVGIEALSQYKKVITLGKAFYNIEGIVEECVNFEKLNKLIDKNIGLEVNKDLIDKFLNYLRFKYNIEGYWGCNNRLTAKNIYRCIGQEKIKSNNMRVVGNE